MGPLEKFLAAVAVAVAAFVVLQVILFVKLAQTEEILQLVKASRDQE